MPTTPRCVHVKHASAPTPRLRLLAASTACEKYFVFVKVGVALVVNYCGVRAVELEEAGQPMLCDLNS